MVIVILGILSVTALPKFFNQNRFTEHVFFTDTLNAIRYAQKLAVATGCNVKFSVSSHTYRLTRQGHSASKKGCPMGAAYALAVPRPGSSNSHYSGNEPTVTLTSSTPFFIFNALGTASEGVSLTVAGTKKISVIAETGFVYAP